MHLQKSVQLLGCISFLAHIFYALDIVVCAAALAVPQHYSTIGIFCHFYILDCIKLISGMRIVVQGDDPPTASVKTGRASATIDENIFNFAVI